MGVLDINSYFLQGFNFYYYILLTLEHILILRWAAKKDAWAQREEESLVTEIG